ncbi:MAG: Asp23/Gls24 family envelope stress response protein [Geodermatophilaceae bacterium]|nr:Asp23/Gls24 family envelope stress response protein [Geodermatophilaceae bacterium]
MTPPQESSSLPCGTDVDELTVQVVERTPPLDPEHQAGCPYCRAALAELSVLWSPVHALAEEDVVAPTDLVQRVLDEIQELDYTGGRAVIAAVDGDTAIAVRVVAVIARKAADSVDGTLLAMSRVSAGVEVGAVGRSVVVQLDLIAALGVHLPALSTQIQRTVRDHVAALTGLSVVAVDVSVVEVAEGILGG